MSNLYKSLPLFLICFFLSFHYYILKTLKDTLVITAENSGADTIPFIKVWLLLPASFVMVFLFTWCIQKFSLTKVFYIFHFSFIVFFLFFTFCLYPFRNEIHPIQLAEKLSHFFPIGWRGFIASFRNWSFSLFYVIAECWTPIIYGLFWALANEITSLTEAKKTYPFLMFFGNLSAVCAGLISERFSKIQYMSFLPFGYNAWDQSVALLTVIMTLASCIVIALFYRYYSCYLSNKKMETKRDRLPFFASLKILARSKHLCAIALVVFCFNMITHLVDVVWKDQIQSLYPESSDYHAYMSSVTAIVGWLSAFLTLFVCTGSLYFFGWTTTALASPLITLLSGAIFFFFLLLPESSIGQLGYIQFFFSSSLPLTAFFGSLHICLTRSSKYSLLDPAKEMAFIPLPSEMKQQGKAAIDGICTNLGKASSSFLFQIILFIFPTISSCVPIVSLVFVVALLVCVYSIIYLGTFVRISTQKLDLLKT